MAVMTVKRILLTEEQYATVRTYMRAAAASAERTASRRGAGDHARKVAEEARDALEALEWGNGEGE